MTRELHVIEMLHQQLLWELLSIYALSTHFSMLDGGDDE